MKVFILLTALLFYTSISKAQQKDTLLYFQNQHKKINKRGMVVLSSWASVNILAGGIGYFTTTNNEVKNIHLMNSGWGLINGTLALSSLLTKQKIISNYKEAYKLQHKTEKIFLANTILDVVYVSAGTTLIQVSRNQNSKEKKEQLTGFGKSIIIQGVFLFAFDLSILLTHQKNSKVHLDF